MLITDRIHGQRASDTCLARDAEKLLRESAPPSWPNVLFGSWPSPSATGCDSTPNYCTWRRFLDIGLSAASCVDDGHNQYVPTIVLVHGSWLGGWCWREVATMLRSRDVTVYAPSLTGLGARSHLATRDVGLRTHVEDVSNLLRSEDLHDVMLVGHSYAGLVIGGSASVEISVNSCSSLRTCHAQGRRSLMNGVLRGGRGLKKRFARKAMAGAFPSLTISASSRRTAAPKLLPGHVTGSCPNRCGVSPNRSSLMPSGSRAFLVRMFSAAGTARGYPRRPQLSAGQCARWTPGIGQCCPGHPKQPSCSNSSSAKEKGHPAAIV